MSGIRQHRGNRNTLHNLPALLENAPLDSGWVANRSMLRIKLPIVNQIILRNSKLSNPKSTAKAKPVVRLKMLTNDRDAFFEDSVAFEPMLTLVNFEFKKKLLQLLWQFLGSILRPGQ